MDQAFAGAWWEDVEHLQEAAERRSQERARAKREGREPVALTPLRPLRDAERAAPVGPERAAASYPADAHSTGRFRRQSPGAPRSAAPVGPRAVGREVAVGYATATTTATAAAVLAPAPELELGPEPTVDAELARLAAPAQPAERPATPVAPERPSRRDELARLAREQAQAAAQTRPRVAGAGVEGRRTIEIRGRVVGPPPALAIVADPVDAPAVPRRRAARRPADRFAAHPDRIAMWAFLLGMFLILVAALSAHGA